MIANSEKNKQIEIIKN